MPLQLDDRTIQTDEEGYLVDPAEWDEAVGQALAAAEGIALTPAHQAVIGFMRDYYQEHQIIPDVRHVNRYLAEEGGHGAAARQVLFELFPFGYVKQACRIAGMRRPRAWSTG